MKIGVMHLSDIHLSCAKDIDHLYLSRAIESIKLLEEIEYLLIVISGDITSSGQKLQFEVAKEFLVHLRRYSIEILKIPSFNISWVLVPGNHDVESYDALDPVVVESSLSNGHLNTLIDFERKRMFNFTEFSKEYNLFKNKNEFLLTIRNWKFNNYTVRMNLINSAVLTMKYEDKGLHYLPTFELKTLQEDRHQSDYEFTIMHHPFEWYQHENKKSIEEIIRTRSDVVFWGHEHNPKNYNIEEYYASCLFSQGGQFANKGYWKDSEFNYIVFDLKESKYKFHRFKHLDNRYKQQNNDSIWCSLRKNCNIDENFYIDNKLIRQEDLRKLFVFPDLIDKKSLSGGVSNKLTINSIEAFLSYLSSSQKVVVYGKRELGKTYLLKAMMDYYSRYNDVYCIYTNEVDIPNSNKLEKRLFEIVSSYYPNIDKHQIRNDLVGKKRKLILLYDNLHLIPTKNLGYVLSELDNYCDTIICTFTESITMTIEDMERYSYIFNSFAKFEIDEFYGKKRRELIRSSLSLFSNDKKFHDNDVIAVEDSLKQQRSYMSTQPSFIVKYSSYYFENKDQNTLDNVSIDSIFSSIFETSITLSLKEYTNQKYVDVYKRLLSNIAYNIHLHKKTNGISFEDMSHILKTYHEEYGEKVDYRSFRESIIKSEIIVEDSNGMFYFRNIDLHSYFLAINIISRCDEDSSLIIEDINYLLDYSCFEINSNTLLFIMYLLRNQKLLKSIITKSEELLSNWEEFAISKKDIGYLFSSQEEIKVRLPNKNEREKYEKRQEEKERDDYRRGSSPNYLKLYDYNEDDVLIFVHQLQRAISLLTITMKILPNFSRELKKDVKKKLNDIYYRMPNKIFFKWAKLIDDNFEDIVNEFLKIENNVDVTAMVNKDDRLKVERKIREITLLTYKSILRLAVDYSVNPSTYKWLDNYESEFNVNYEIQKLIALSRIGKYDELYDSAVKLFDDSNVVIVKSWIKMIIIDMLVKPNGVQQRDFDRFSSKFIPRNEKKNILLQKAKKTLKQS